MSEIPTAEKTSNFSDGQACLTEEQVLDVIAWLKSGLSAKYRKPVCLGHAAALSVLEWPRNPRAGINADRRPLLTPEEQGLYLILYKYQQIQVVLLTQIMLTVVASVWMI